MYFVVLVMSKSLDVVAYFVDIWIFGVSLKTNLFLKNKEGSFMSKEMKLVFNLLAVSGEEHAIMTR